jgi:hypothetical protein
MMMLIHDLAKQTGVPAKTIRYYESIGLLPRPKRATNNYRQYTPADVERLRFIASARNLGFSLADVAEILAARDDGIAPCHLPLTLPLLIALTAGTAFGVWIVAPRNVILISAISTGFFIGGLALAFKWLTQPASLPNPKVTPSLPQSKTTPMK